MAYITGTAANFADLKTAIENACTSNGWALADGILSKNGCFFQLIADSLGGYPQLRLHGGTGKSGSTLTGQPPSNYGAKVASPVGNQIVFPINYEIHLFTDPDEVYCIINYNSDFYQQLSFGKSDIPGIGGTGAWFTGAYRHDYGLTDATYAHRVFTAISWPEITGVATYAGMCVGLFFEGNASQTGGSYFASFVHTGLDSTPWRSGHGGDTLLSGYRGAGLSVGSLLMSLPNISNQATILLPIKPVARRSSGGATIIANPKNARYLRIDNVVPGEIITFGADQWKVYPFYRKDATVRNGVGWSSGATHSGTFGYAIKYTGT
ncbi:virion structural protein [Pseudomonas phage vB_PaeS_SCUT-S4]|nr:virion structural protein [Pseudomonas phage vB_PaeS_SCUT-S4]